MLRSVVMSCELCDLSIKENVIFSNRLFRIVHVYDVYYPGFIRLILNRHVKELSELTTDELSLVFEAIVKIEREIINLMQADKINIASLGNVVPHLHWHIIPRYFNDRHFPNPIWGNVNNDSYIVNNDLLDKEKLLIQNLRNKFN